MAAQCSECGKAAKHEPDCPALARILKAHDERKKERVLDQLHRWEREGVVKR